MTDPYLADGKKFEMRLFVSITSVEPLSVYLYDDFYLRVADTAYDPNLSASLQVGAGRCCLCSLLPISCGRFGWDFPRWPVFL